LPVQSCDPEILRKMRRAHTAEQFVDTVTTLARRVPGVSIGADVIVGFPGETPAAFERTRLAIESLPLSYLHVFAYSDRRDTEAAQMSGKVSKPVQAERSQLLRDLSLAQTRRFAAESLGAPSDIVVHKTRAKKSGRLRAVTDNALKVALNGPDAWLGTRRTVRLIEVSDTGICMAV
jgi:threonylcarbamoyladenosine tRNA methylthiotransferase MtaB